MSLDFRRLSGEAEARECAQWMAQSEPWLTLGRGVDAALRLLRIPTKEVWVAESGQGLEGFIVLDMSGPLPGYIQTVCVRPESRGRGIGAALVGFVEQRVFRHSPNLFLCVSSFNTGAQRFYQSLGYEVVGTMKAFLVPEHDEILMRKTLGPWTEFRTRQQGEPTKR
jgi:ribosomal protein S18 acetylase RimI-like enzyme